MKCESCESCAANSFAMEVAGNLTAAGVKAPKVCRVYPGSVKVLYTHSGPVPSNTLLLSAFPTFVTEASVVDAATADDHLGLVLGVVGGVCVLGVLLGAAWWLRRKKGGGKRPLNTDPSSTKRLRQAKPKTERFTPEPLSPMLVSSLFKRRAIHRVDLV